MLQIVLLQYNKKERNMKVPNNKLLLFNSRMLLNKREVIESFNDFLKHHRRKEN
jgi:hypothetical protein